MLLANAVLEIAWLGRSALSSERLIAELVHLAFSMIHGRDP